MAGLAGAAVLVVSGVCVCTLEPSQTASECFAYCSTIGRILVVTMRCARLKLWSISVSQLAPVYSSTLIVNMPCKVNVMVCSSFSSSSVSVRFLCCDVDPLKAIVSSAYCGLSQTAELESLRFSWLSCRDYSCGGDNPGCG